MKIVWECSLENHNDIWEPNLEGIFYSRDNTISFYFMDGNSFVALEMNQNGEILSDTSYPFNSETLPDEWFLAKLCGHEYLVFDDENGFDVEANAMILQSPQKFLEIFSSHQDNKISFEDDPFAFDDYIISHKGSWGYNCHKDGKLVWSISLKGYLYTEMTRYGDTIVFGTSGQGGHFYGLDLYTGEFVFDINTKGTERFCYSNGYFYIVLCGSIGKLLKIELTGTIADEISFQNEISTCCPMALFDEKLYLLTIKKDKTPKIFCISI